MVWRPSLEEVEAAARVLARAGNHHRWWKPYKQSYEEMFVTDLMAKIEFDGIVEQMLMAAHEARSEATWLAEQYSDGRAREGSHLSWGHERTCTP